ncbi:hypothetical protein ABBQ38_008278 [Trebouxia sp. C0009 RCD-2024]
MVVAGLEALGLQKIVNEGVVASFDQPVWHREVLEAHEQVVGAARVFRAPFVFGHVVWALVLVWQINQA